MHPRITLMLSTRFNMKRHLPLKNHISIEMLTNSKFLFKLIAKALCTAEQRLMIGLCATQQVYEKSKLMKSGGLAQVVMQLTS